MAPQIIPIYASDDSSDHNGDPPPLNYVTMNDFLDRRHRNLFTEPAVTRSQGPPSPPFSPGGVLESRVDAAADSTPRRHDERNETPSISSSGSEEDRELGEDEGANESDLGNAVDVVARRIEGSRSERAAGSHPLGAEEGDKMADQEDELEDANGADVDDDVDVIDIRTEEPRSKKAAGSHPLVQEEQDKTADQLDEVADTHSAVQILDMHDNPVMSTAAEGSSPAEEKAGYDDLPRYRREFVTLSLDDVTDQDLQKQLPRTFFFFLVDCTVLELRGIAKELSVKQGRLKHVLISSSFLAFMLQLHKGMPRVSFMLSGMNLQKFNDYRNLYETKAMTVEMPTLSHIMEVSRSEANGVSIAVHKAFTTSLAKSAGSRGGGKETSQRTRKRKLSAGECSQSVSAVTGSDHTGLNKRRSTEKGMEASRSNNPSTNHEVGTPLSSPCCNDGEDANPDPASGNAADQEGDKPFSISEFARLLVIIRDDEGCRRAFLDSYQVLGKDQLDRGERSTDIWKTVIEPCFNDKATKPHCNCSEVVSGVDPACPPRKHRSGEQLKKLLYWFRAKFGGYLDKYRKSGQNVLDFKSFIMRSGLSENTALGQRVLIAGFIYRLGTLRPDTEIVSCIERMIGSSGRGGYDAPVTRNGDEIYASQTGWTSTTRARRLALEEKSVVALEAIAGTLQSKKPNVEAKQVAGQRTIERGSSASATSPVGGPTPAADTIIEDRALASEVETIRMLTEAVKKKQSFTKDEVFLKKVYSTHINKLKKRLEKMDSAQEENQDDDDEQ